MIQELSVTDDSPLHFYNDDQASSISLASQQSCATDEGYSSDEKQQRISWIETLDDRTKQQHSNKPSPTDREIPILRSTRTIRITYTPTTYTLTLTIVLLLLHHLVISSSVSTTAITFSAVFTCFHIVFHLAHLFAHLFERLTLERHCVVYGTWLFWTGYLLGVFVFHQHDILYNTISPTFLFWLLMLERRNAWGILVWEYVGWLDQPLTSSSSPPGWWQIGSIRLLAFRIWCLLGTGSFWGLLYLILATMAEDDTAASLFWLLQSRHLFELLLVSVAGGLMMITFWSFWTFQYRGILWHHELRKGVIVWYSEGLAFAGDIG